MGVNSTIARTGNEMDKTVNELDRGVGCYM